MPGTMRTGELLPAKQLNAKSMALQLMKRWASISAKFILHEFLRHDGKPQKPYAKNVHQMDFAHRHTRIHFPLKPICRICIDWTHPGQYFCVGFQATSETKWVHGVGANELNRFRFQLMYSVVLFLAKNSLAITFERAWSWSFAGFMEFI